MAVNSTVVKGLAVTLLLALPFGIWGGCTGDVQSPPPEPENSLSMIEITPQPETFPRPPKLISPVNDAVMDNLDSDPRDKVVWDFDWADVPDATQYHIYVVNRNYPSIPLINGLTTSSFCQYVSDAWIGGANCYGWIWKVRAQANGVWSAWSEIRTFSVTYLATHPRLPPVSKPTVPTVPQAPTLISPAPGAVISYLSFPSENGIIWDFDWSDVPGATQYEIVITLPVFSPRFPNPVIYTWQTDSSSYRSEYRELPTIYQYYPYFAQILWQWKVRAYANGRWSNWSEVRSFYVRFREYYPTAP